MIDKIRAVGIGDNEMSNKARIFKSVRDWKAEPSRVCKVKVEVEVG